MDLNNDLLITDISKLEKDEDYYIMFYNIMPYYNYNRNANITQYNGIYNCIFNNINNYNINNYNINSNDKFIIFENKEDKNMESLVLHQLITELPSSISEEYTHAYFILRGELLCCCNIFEIPNNTSYILK